MKHLELERENCKGIFKKGKPYSICLGAGVCFGIMPNWEELTYEVLKNIVNPKIDWDEFKEIQKNLGWSLDSLLQASLNHLIGDGGSVDDFNEIMQEILYSSVFERAAKYDLEDDLKKFISDPFRRDKNAILPLYDFFKKEYSDTSLFQICEFLLKAAKTGFAPLSILTFNADVLLHSILTLIQLKETYDSEGNVNSADFEYKAIHHIIESNGHKIPIYHIHGSIVPNSGKRDARENLVFPESTYHEVSGSTYSWQQSVFQYYAQRTRIVFIGLSMSDPNIRRWLSHTNNVLNQDVYNISGKRSNVTNHIWITPSVLNETEKDLKKLGLYHLGIKVGEISSWTNIKNGLMNLIE